MTDRQAKPSPRACARRDLSPKPRTKRGVSTNAVDASGEKLRIKRLRLQNVDANTNDTRTLCNPDRPLTAKQIAFVKAWASGETISSASHKAGYADSGTLAYRMVKDPAILKIYEKEKAAYEAAGEMTKKKVMDMLIEAYDCAKLISEPSSMVAAAREIGKLCGYYVEPAKRFDISITNHPLMQRMSRLSDEELLKLIADDEGEDDIIDVEANEVALLSGVEGLQ